MAASRTAGLLTLVILLVVFSALTHPALAQPSFSQWVQTSQGDFESGVLVNLDTASYPGDVRLSHFDEFVVGNPFESRAGSRNNSLATILLDDASAIADRAGVVTSFEIRSNNLGGTVQLKVFRDNGTHVIPLAIAPIFPVTETPFRKGVALKLGSNDILGATISGVELDYGNSNLASSVLLMDVNAPLPRSDWARENRTWSLRAQAGVPGVLFSSLKDTGGVLSWGTLEWRATLGSTSSIVFNTRTSIDGEAWTEWSPDYTTSGDAVISPPSRFIQYKATLVSGSPGDIPSLHEVTITYSPTPKPNPSSLFVWSDKTRASVGEPVRLSGRILPAQVESMILMVIEPGGKAVNQTVVSDASGSIFAELIPTSQGAWIAVLIFSGSATLTPAVSAPQIIVVESSAFALVSSTLTSIALTLSVVTVAAVVALALRVRRLKAT